MNSYVFVIEFCSYFIEKCLYIHVLSVQFLLTMQAEILIADDSDSDLTPPTYVHSLAPMHPITFAPRFVSQHLLAPMTVWGNKNDLTQYQHSKRILLHHSFPHNSYCNPVRFLNSYFRYNKYTSVFQSIVNTYGIPR